MTRRRSTRQNAQTPKKSSSPSPPVDGQPDADPSMHNDENCPACPAPSTNARNALSKESWIRCDTCLKWYHWRCAGSGGDVDVIDKWHCKSCLNADAGLSITFKAPARKSFRKRTQRDYAILNAGLESDPQRWFRFLEGKPMKDSPFQRPSGAEIGIHWLEGDDRAMTEPVIIDSPEGLGMKMPSADFTVDSVVELVGQDTSIEVIDVATQSTSPGWTLGKWRDYFYLKPEERDKICNVISLEISGTKLADKILPPKLVRDLDWVENYWPTTKRGRGHTYPKVQLYCLMGVANAWTDWHIDFAGSSVYYHIIYGSKIFYFIRPSPGNLAAYERWSGTELQNHSWLGDMVDEVFKVELTQGNTMIIPTGWIHAVYTPVDSLVFGGNFLHSYDVPKQLRVRNIEIATQVPKKFRFPMFSRLCWYVGEKLLRDLKTHGSNLPPRVLESMVALADFLVGEARMMEGGNENAKKEAKEQVPADKIKDAPALARELRWRLRVAGGYSSDEESSHVVHQGKANGAKRKRTVSPAPVPDLPFKNYTPKSWDALVDNSTKPETKLEKRPPPVDDENWVENWARPAINEGGDTDGDQRVEVRSTRHTTIKVRRTDVGLERHIIERVVENWKWT